MQGVTTFTGTMLEVKKTHVLAVLDLPQTSDLKKFIKGVVSNVAMHSGLVCMIFQTTMHIHTMLGALRPHTAVYGQEVIATQNVLQRNVCLVLATFVPM